MKTPSTIRTSVLAAGFYGLLLAGEGASAKAFDRDGLVQSGEVYLVEFHDRIAAQARHCERDRATSCASYFNHRLAEIEAGTELFVLPVAADDEIPSMDDRAALTRAYDETYSLITSEAADMAPAQVAEIQVAYEGWVHALAEADGMPNAWRARWEQAMDYFYQGESVPSVSVSPGAVIFSSVPQPVIR